METTVSVVEKVREQYNFSVDKFPLSGPDNLRTPFYGLFRSDNNESVGIAVKSVYVPHTTDDVVALVEASMAAFECEVTVQCGFDDGHQLVAAPSKDYRLSVFCKDRDSTSEDSIFPRVSIRAGYDGKAFTASLGYYRDLCKNLHIMRCVRGMSVSIRHTSKLRSKMDDLIIQFQQLKKSWVTLDSLIRNMSQRQVNLVDYLNAIYPQPTETEGRAVTMHRNRTELIVRRLQNEYQALGKGLLPQDHMVSAWDAFNAVQGYTQHDSIRRGNPTSFQRAMMAQSNAAVLKAEELALAA
jgi:hypothetical protein